LLHYMDKQTHPLSLPETQALMHQFLSDVIDDFREHEIKEWLQGLTISHIEEILQRPGHETLRTNPFIIPFVYLHYAVVPNAQIVEMLKHWLHQHPMMPKDNEILAKTKLHFDRIFKGKTSYIYDPNNGGHKSY
jgi:hypothetical protein